MSNSIYSFSVPKKDSSEQSLSEFKDKVLLIVNTASKCGFTPQYDGLQNLYDKHKDNGFEILGFPCDQFGHQEPGDDEAITQFCTMNFNITFPVFSKIEVNGPNALSLYDYLKNEAPGIFGSKSIKWNFTKFLISKSGKVLKRYSPKTKPEQIEKDILEALA
ncbi:glutathione peroxidase [Alteromonadaceae bacterium M269]|nr:glutathione peroxidase [Alteromonadaceae bacterium M269]